MAKKVRVMGLKEVKKSLRQLPVELQKAMKLGLKKVAVHAMGRLIQETPKNKLGGGGMTRRKWSLLNYSSGRFVGFEINNTSKVMRFLEYGTKSHGPRTAKFLYVPLKKKAIYGWSEGLKFGKDYVLAKKVKGIPALRIVDKRRRIVEKQGSKVMQRLMEAAERVWA